MSSSRVFSVVEGNMHLTSIGQGFLIGEDTNEPMEIRSIPTPVHLKTASCVVGTYT